VQSFGIFGFEVDFGGTPRCIPMSVRLKLDLAGIKPGVTRQRTSAA
jgi:hypothetical protein